MSHIEKILIFSAILCVAIATYLNALDIEELKENHKPPSVANDQVKEGKI